MDFLIYSGYYLALFTIPIAVYSLFFKKNTKNKKDFVYLIKYYFARSAVESFQNNNNSELSLKNEELESNTTKTQNELESCDSQHFYGVDVNSNSLSIKFIVKHDLEAEVHLCLRLPAHRKNYTFPGKRIAICSLNQHQWRSKNLQIEILEPFKRARICFNGLLTSENGAPEHVQFNFIWIAGTKPLFYPKETKTSLLTEAVASVKWRDGDWLSSLGDKTRKGYEQFGSLKGFVRGEAFTSTDDLILNLPSCRSRFWSSLHEKDTLKKSFHLFLATKNGILFSIWIEKVRDSGLNIKYGHFLSKTGEIHAIDNIDLDLNHFHTLSNTFSMHICAGNKVYKSIIHLNSENTIKLKSSTYEINDSVAECDLNTQQARGIIELCSFFQNNNENTVKNIKNNRYSIVSNTEKFLVIDLKETEAACVELTGGKGSSLALLNKYKSSAAAFHVPEGFAVTVHAFNLHLKENARIKQALNDLEDVFCQRTNKQNYEEICLQVVEAFNSEKIPEIVIDQVKEKILQADNSTRWAVRSSGICEDSDELSAAGQNETFLGCKSVENVIEAISHCWASLFTYQSVKYRHQNGLAIKTEMAVVVQQMVASDCAGVLFTYHPTTGNVAEMVITSNHGLGESVVSGLSEPDTVIINRRNDRHLQIKEKLTGSKGKLYRMSSQNNGIQLEEKQTDLGFSLSDEQALLLGTVGIELENYFNDARDIEWAFFDNNLYLLQARPITTLTNWSDFELLHEFDMANFTEDVVFTVANTGEVFPGCISVLTLSSIARELAKILQTNVNGRIDEFSSACLGIYQHHVFIDVINSIHRNATREIHLSSQILDLAIFGRPVINDTIHKLAVERFGYASSMKLALETFKMIKFAWKNENNLKILKKLNENSQIQLNAEKESVQEIFNKITKFLKNDFGKIALFHCTATTVSVFYQIMTMNILVGNSKSLNNDHYTDSAEILQHCGEGNDVISAEIPAKLEQIANVLRKNNANEEFAKTSADKGRTWLKENCGEASVIFEEFLQKHGHRTLKEFDLMQETWGMNPEQVIKMVQANCQITTSKKEEKVIRTVDDIINGLKSPKTDTTRKILKFLMKKSRRAVAIREQTKSEIVNCVHKLRIAYKELARKMVNEGILPDEGMVFCLTHYELGKIIAENNKSSSLINKAMRRRRLFPAWNEFKFAEISYGLPEPEAVNDIFIRNDDGDGVKLSGTPVYSGVVKARACVINSLEEINELQNGDILITYCTDIGWSPYFPMLAGIVTELGGLVSHGAVIAREYGLPCIVGVQKASRVFRTGDVVLLSGKSGTIELIN